VTTFASYAQGTGLFVNQTSKLRTKRNEAMIKTVFGLAIAMAATTAYASSPQAWEQMNARANRACIAMSGLARPVLLAKRISFSDVIGVEVRMIRGTDSRGRVKRLLCAYNRSTGRTEVQDGDAWNGATVQP
jgi:hypothetical protein